MSKISYSKKLERQIRRDKAGLDFSSARHLAFLAGLYLEQKTADHYQLRGDGLTMPINLYPATGIVFPPVKVKLANGQLAEFMRDFLSDVK